MKSDHICATCEHWDKTFLRRGYCNMLAIPDENGDGLVHVLTHQTHTCMSHRPREARKSYAKPIIEPQGPMMCVNCDHGIETTERTPSGIRFVILCFEVAKGERLDGAPYRMPFQARCPKWRSK